MSNARIYQPAKNAMQSGKANVQKWILEIIPREQSLFVEPLMGWTGSTDTNRQLRFEFPTKEAAIAFAESKKLKFKVKEPKEAKTIIKAYSDNFTKKR